MRFVVHLKLSFCGVGNFFVLGHFIWITLYLSDKVMMKLLSMNVWFSKVVRYLWMYDSVKLSSMNVWLGCLQNALFIFNLSPLAPHLLPTFPWFYFFYSNSIRCTSVHCASPRWKNPPSFSREGKPETIMKFYIKRLAVIFLICAEILPSLNAARSCKSRGISTKVSNSKKGVYRPSWRCQPKSTTAPQEPCQCVIEYLCDKKNVLDQTTQSGRYNDFFKKYVSD